MSSGIAIGAGGFAGVKLTGGAATPAAPGAIASVTSKANGCTGASSGGIQPADAYGAQSWRQSLASAGVPQSEEDSGVSGQASQAKAVLHAAAWLNSGKNPAAGLPENSQIPQLNASAQLVTGTQSSKKTLDTETFRSDVHRGIGKAADGAKSASGPAQEKEGTAASGKPASPSRAGLQVMASLAAVVPTPPMQVPQAKGKSTPSSNSVARGTDLSQSGGTNPLALFAERSAQGTQALEAHGIHAGASTEVTATGNDAAHSPIQAADLTSQVSASEASQITLESAIKPAAQHTPPEQSPLPGQPQNVLQTTNLSTTQAGADAAKSAFLNKSAAPDASASAHNHPAASRDLHTHAVDSTPASAANSAIFVQAAVTSSTTAHLAHGAPNAQPVPVGSSVAVATNAPARDPFSTIDSGSSAEATSWTHAGTHSAEAGFQDPALGWVGVRAQASGGAVHASVLASSNSAAQALDGHLPGLHAYLADHHGIVNTVTVARSDSSSGSAGGQHAGQGSGQGMQQSMNQHMGQGSNQGYAKGTYSGTEAIPTSHTGFAAVSSRGSATPTTSATASPGSRRATMREGSSISLVA